MLQVDNPQTAAGDLEEDFDKETPSSTRLHQFSALVGGCPCERRR